MHPRVSHPDFGATNWHEAVRPGAGLRRTTHIPFAAFLQRRCCCSNRSMQNLLEMGRKWNVAGCSNFEEQQKRRKNAKIARIYMTLTSESRGKSDITLQRRWLNVER